MEQARPTNKNAVSEPTGARSSAPVAAAIISWLAANGLCHQLPFYCDSMTHLLSQQASITAGYFTLAAGQVLQDCWCQHARAVLLMCCCARK